MSKIYLVAGHGGSDPGACGYGRREKDDTLRMTLDVGAALTKLGHTVRYNRTNDVDTDMYGYIRDCNAFGTDICVSIHRNSFNGNATGYETCIYANTGKTKILADALNAGMAGLGFNNRGSKIRPDLAVLNSTSMDAALLEVGFIDTKTDNDIFVNRYNDIIKVITESILKALGQSGTVDIPSNKPSNPPVEPSKPNTGNHVVPNIIYAVKTRNHGILPDVKNREDFAGWGNDEIIGIKIGVTSGSVKYRVHTVNGGWLGYVTGNNWNDFNNGYAGDDVNAIDAIEVYYNTDANATGGKYYEAVYQVKPKNGSGYYPNQHDNVVNKDMDGYAGCFGVPFVELLMSLE